MSAPWPLRFAVEVLHAGRGGTRTGLVELKRFLAEHGLRVVVFGAPRGLERALELAFRSDVQLLFSSDPAQVEKRLERGDVAAVMLCGDDDYQ